MKIIIYIICFGMLLTACSKEVTVDEPSLNVTLEAAKKTADTINLKLTDTAKFVITGYADNILLYTGENGRVYENAKRTSVVGIPQMSFTSNAQFGLQTNTLQILATNKLPKVDSANVVTANWTNITSRTPLSTGSGAVNSSVIKLDDIVNGPKDSLFIAFKYTGTAGTTQRTWTITNLAINNLLADGTTVPLLSLATDVSYWTPFKIAHSAANWIPSATQLIITGGTATAPNNTSWIVSRPIYVGRVNPDVPILIKQLASTIPMYTINGKTFTGYMHNYTKAGLYKATIVGFNNSVDEEKTVVKEFYIRVTP